MLHWCKIPDFANDFSACYPCKMVKTWQNDKIDCLRPTGCHNNSCPFSDLIEVVIELAGSSIQLS